MNAVTRAPAATTVRADSVSELRAFLAESVALLPAGVQIAVLEAIQQSGEWFGDDECGLLNHAGLLVMLATKDEVSA